MKVIIRFCSCVPLLRRHATDAVKLAAERKSRVPPEIDTQALTTALDFAVLGAMAALQVVPEEQV
jgi:hypothetical protein